METIMKSGQNDHLLSQMSFDESQFPFSSEL